jgi:hypothetical protein
MKQKNEDQAKKLTGTRYSLRRNAQQFGGPNEGCDYYDTSRLVMPSIFRTSRTLSSFKVCLTTFPSFGYSAKSRFIIVAHCQDGSTNRSMTVSLLPTAWPLSSSLASIVSRHERIFLPPSSRRRLPSLYWHSLVVVSLAAIAQQNHILAAHLAQTQSTRTPSQLPYQCDPS